MESIMSNEPQVPTEPVPARPMAVCTTAGLTIHAPRGSATRAKIAAHWIAIGHYLDSGDVGPITEFAQVRVGGMALASDPQQIDDLATCGALDLNDIYQDNQGPSRVIGDE